MKPGETYYVRLGTKPEPITIKEHGPKRRTKAALLAELEIANQEVARLENEVATANKMRFDYNAEVAELNRRLATTTSNYEARGRQIEAIRVVIGRIPSAPQPMSHTATRTSPSLPPHTTDLALDLGQAQAFLASIYALLYA